MENRKPSNDAAEKCLAALDAADRAGDEIPTVVTGAPILGTPTIGAIESRPLRIELDEDDQADDVRIVHRFPVYVQHLLARRISIPRLLTGLGLFPIDELDDWTDAELADFADQINLIGNATPRQIAFGRILAVTLRHFGDDPVAVRGAIVLVGMIANPRPRLGSGPSELAE
jgi:hypothetical protein